MPEEGETAPEGEAPTEAAQAVALPPPQPRKKKPKKRNKEGKEDGGGARKKPRKNSRKDNPGGLSAAQLAANEQMRRALEEDQYSAYGSIVETDSEEEDEFLYRGIPVRLDRAAVQQTAKKGALVDPRKKFQGNGDDKEEEDEASGRARRGGKGHKKKRRKEQPPTASEPNPAPKDNSSSTPAASNLGLDAHGEDDLDRDGGSIFGQTQGSSNSTWVECDKCKKWRRLRGVVDAKKLPSKWFCSMNKNDPERSRCSAPEEEYEAPHTPESAADARARKHLRVWVRRLQCNEQYESRQPTLTRGKKRAAVSGSKDPYEWVRCCNPSCGKWRAVLKMMDAKTNVVDRTNNGEWYCVMNTWDEKTASCAAPQENLPAVGCPPWVMQDHN